MLPDDEESFCPNKLWVIQGQLLKDRASARAGELIRFSHNARGESLSP
jgi:hypothetical protein